jgi:hypothetical protein
LEFFPQAAKAAEPMQKIVRKAGWENRGAPVDRVRKGCGLISKLDKTSAFAYEPNPVAFEALRQKWEDDFAAKLQQELSDGVYGDATQVVASAATSRQSSVSSSRGSRQHASSWSAAGAGSATGGDRKGSGKSTNHYKNAVKEKGAGRGLDVASQSTHAPSQSQTDSYSLLEDVLGSQLSVEGDHGGGQRSGNDMQSGSHNPVSPDPCRNQEEHSGSEFVLMRHLAFGPGWLCFFGASDLGRNLGQHVSRTTRSVHDPRLQVQNHYAPSALVFRSKAGKTATGS